MKLTKIISAIENFASLEFQESWDCSGFQLDFGEKEVKKIMLSLSVVENTIEQAIQNNCDMVIAHHPLFFIPFTINKGIPVYSAHTNLDKAQGGTTDTLIEILGLSEAQKIGDFLRLIELNEEISLDSFINLIKEKLNIKTLRVVNNKNMEKIKKIAFCAGSGSDFIKEAEKIADAFVTGDVKYHTALESNVIMIDVGHFESEHPVLKTLANLLKNLEIEVIIADEKSPFINY